MRRLDEERRGATRYRFDTSVQLQDGATGQLRDMSTAGLFFETEQAHTAGDTIRLTVTLNGSTVQCAGRIVRVEAANGRFGVAVKLDSYDFC